jgi:DNA polymerase III delta prime subunit
VYIEPEVVEAGPKNNFEIDEEDNPAKSLTKAFKEFMKSKCNVLLLSGEAGSGKTTACLKLQHWIMREYTKERLAQGVDVVLLPITLAQLKDPANSIFREGIDLAYDKQLRPKHAEELQRLVQDPKSRTPTEIVFFLNAYHELPPSVLWKNLWCTNNLEMYRAHNAAEETDHDEPDGLKVSTIVVNRRMYSLSKSAILYTQSPAHPIP